MPHTWNANKSESPAAPLLSVPFCCCGVAAFYPHECQHCKCFLAGLYGYLATWYLFTVYLDLKIKFPLVGLVKHMLTVLFGLLFCLAAGVYMGQPHMQFTPQSYATAMGGSVPPTTTMMGGGTIMSSMAMPNGGYVGMQQQGAMPANQGQNMYSMQQGQWNMGQVTQRDSNLCIKLHSEWWWLAFNSLAAPVSVTVWIHTALCSTALCRAQCSNDLTPLVKVQL